MKHTLVEVRFHPIRKNLQLGPLRTCWAEPRPGESARRAAERVLGRRYRVRDYLIVGTEMLTDRV